MCGQGLTSVEKFIFPGIIKLEDDERLEIFEMSKWLEFYWSRVSLFLQCVNYQIKIDYDSVNGLETKNFTYSRFWRLIVLCPGLQYNVGFLKSKIWIIVIISICLIIRISYWGPDLPDFL